MKRTYNEDLVSIESYGGITGIQQKLKVDPKQGLTGSDYVDRTTHFGNNMKEPLKRTHFCVMFIRALNDFMLKILLVCATLSIIIDMIFATPEERQHAWIDGVAIYTAVLVVSGVSSVVDYHKEGQFLKSKAKSREKDVCIVLRNGKEEEIHHDFLHVGDIIKIIAGMQIPVDGIVLSSQGLAADESAMTGESDELAKDTFPNCKAK